MRYSIFCSLFIICSLNSFIKSQSIINVDINHPFQTYTIKDGLISNNIYGVIQDQRGFLYFYSDKGISRFDGHHFINFTLKNGLTSQNVWLLTLDSKNRIWIHSHDKFLHYLENDSIINAYSSSKQLSIIHIIEKSPKEMFFIATQNEELLNHITSDSMHFEIVNPNKLGFTHEFLFPNFSLKYNKKAKSETSYKDFEIKSHKKEQIKTLSCSKNESFYSPISFNNYVFCSSNHGLIVIDTNFITKSYIYNSKNEVNRSILDINKNIWVCTKEEGVYVINENNYNGIISLLKNEFPATISYFINNHLYFQDKIGNLFMYQPTSKNIIQIGTFPGINKLNIWFKNEIIISSTEGIFVINYDGLNKRMINFNNWNNKNLNSPTKTLKYKNGLLAFDHPNQFFYINEIDNKVDDKVICQTDSRIKLIYNANNLIYLLTNEEINIFNKEYLLLQKIDLIAKCNRSLPTCIIDFCNEIIFGTENAGLFKIINNEIVSVKKWSIETSIHNIFQFHDNLIVHTNKGIYILDPYNNFIITKSITNEQGITPEEIVGVYPWKNELIIVMPNAIHHINPDSVKVKTYNLRITELTQNNKQITIKDLSQLPPGFKSISISMSLLDFQVSKDVAYQYNLNDNDWQTLAVNTLDLSDLASGSYNLNLRAINKYSNKLLDSKILKLNVLRPWWKTWQFILLINAFLISSIIWGYRKWLNRRNEIKINIRNLEIGLREYKMKALESQMNPHFVYNSLASIQYFIQENKNDEAEHFLTEFGILIRSFLTASRSSQINLKIELELLQKFINLEQIRFSKRFNSEIIIDLKLNLTKIFIPPLLLQPFVENAIQHGLFHRLEGGQLKLNFQASNRDLIVTISDNGIGTEKSKSLKKFSLSNTTSDAMEIFLEKLEIMNKLKPNSLEYSISNLDDNEPYYVGTKIVIIFKNIIVL